MGFWDRADGNAPGNAPESSEMAALRRKAAQAAQLKVMGVADPLAERLAAPAPQLDVVESFQGPWNLGPEAEPVPEEDSGLDWGFTLGPRDGRPKQSAPTLADIFGGPDPEEVRRREMLGEVPAQAETVAPTVGQTAPRGAHSDFNPDRSRFPVMSKEEWERSLADQLARQGVQEEQDLGAKYARGLQRLEQGPLPGFEYGPLRGLKDIVGREVGGAGLRSGDDVTSGVDAFDRPDGGTTYRSQTDDSIFAVSPRKARPEELAGLRSRAFQTQEYGPAPDQNAALMRLSGVGAGDGHVLPGVEGADVSQATLEHEMAQRAARTALEGGEAETRLRQAQAGAAERDPLGLERLAAQSALDRERYSLANAGRAEASLADDQFRAREKARRDAEVQQITTDYLDTRRALEEELAKFPPNLPPGSLEATRAAEIARELERNERRTEMELAQRGVRINPGT